MSVFDEDFKFIQDYVDAIPDLSGTEKNDKIWRIVKNRFYKSDNGWLLKDKFKSSIGEDIQTYLKLYGQKAAIMKANIPEYYGADFDPERFIWITANDIKRIEKPDINIPWQKYVTAGVLDQIPNKSDEVLYFSTPLVHSTPYINSNLYAFSKEDLYWARPQFDAQNLIMVDVNHEYYPVGITLGAEVRDVKLPGIAEPVTELAVYGGIMAWRFEALADYMAEQAEFDKMNFSMSADPEYIKCSVCGGIFKGLDDPNLCEHIRNGQAIIHVIRPHFRSASFLTEEYVPADRYARGKEVYYKKGEQSQNGPAEAGKWTTVYINNLPDAAFAAIESGGEKDADGKTVPRKLRHLPHHNETVKNPNENSSVDIPHLRNALARLPNTKISDALKKKALKHLEKHAKALLSASDMAEYGELFAMFTEDNMDQIEKLTKELDTLKASLLEANKKVSDYERKDREGLIKEKDETIGTLEADVKKLNDEIEALKKEKQTLSEAMETQSKKVSELEAGIAEKDKALAEKEVKIKEAEVTAKNNERKAKLESMKSFIGEKFDEKVQHFSLKLENGEVSGPSDSEFNAFFEAMSLIPTEIVDKVALSHDSGYVPPGSDDKGKSKMDVLFEKF